MWLQPPSTSSGASSTASYPSFSLIPFPIYSFQLLLLSQTSVLPLICSKSMRRSASSVVNSHGTPCSDLHHLLLCHLLFARSMGTPPLSTWALHPVQNSSRNQRCRVTSRHVRAKGELKEEGSCTIVQSQNSRVWVVWRKNEFWERLRRSMVSLNLQLMELLWFMKMDRTSEFYVLDKMSFWPIKLSKSIYFPGEKESNVQNNFLFFQTSEVLLIWTFQGHTAHSVSQYHFSFQVKIMRNLN